MRICIPCVLPGGPEGALAPSFEAMEVLDYYEPDEAGCYEHTLQTFTCGGASCAEPVEAIIRRGTDVLLVAGIRPYTAARLKAAGVRVLHARSRSVADGLRDISSGLLEEIRPRTG